MTAKMKQRAFITLVGRATAWSLVARAQQPATPVIRFLNTRAPEQDAHLLAAFPQGLRENGYRPTCRFCSRPNSRWSGPRRRSASTYRRPCSPAPTR